MSGYAVSDSKNSSIRSIVPVWIIMVTLVFVIPIDHVNGSIRSLLQVDDLRPTIIEIDEIGRVVANESGTLALGNIHINARAVNVIHEVPATVFGGPIIPLVNHHSGMSMPT